jgi:hypothetical protein
MEMVLVGADQSKESTLVSGTAVRGSDRPTTADSEDPPSWGTWATDGKYVVLPKTWSGASSLRRFQTLLAGRHPAAFARTHVWVR